MRTHVKRILRKLGVHSQAEAIEMANGIRATYAPGHREPLAVSRARNRFARGVGRVMSPRPRILSVIGARPEIIQAAPVSEALRRLADEILVHTGQHYDERCPARRSSTPRLPQPAHNLGVGSRPRDEQLDLAEKRLGEVIDDGAPDAVIVRGDTNATLSGARAAVAPASR